ncbi:hypothetical protein CR513_25179, partial [Mucuna pruriens]
MYDASDFGLLSFMDAYLGYNQIRMHPHDEAKIAFITHSGTFCYKSNHIIIWTDLSIRQILWKPNLIGRMVDWTIQLSEFDISFKRRGHIKAQALFDFIIELAPIGHYSRCREWFLSVDGASNQSRSGARVILKGPDRVLVEQSL